MLSTLEKILFITLTIISLIFAFLIVRRIVLILQRGSGRLHWKKNPSRLIEVFINITTLKPTFDIRLLPSLFHGLVAWGFMFFLLINIVDLLEAFIQDYVFFEGNFLGNLFRLGADFFSVAILVGMAALLVRRFILKSPQLSTRADVLIYPNARESIKRDSGDCRDIHLNPCWGALYWPIY